MGGNLLKTWKLPEKRLNPEEYKKLSEKILRLLSEEYTVPTSVSPEKRLLTGIAPSLRQKESHGDLDVIISVKELQGNQKYFYDSFRLFLENQFGYKPHQNTNVFSFPADDFQVDVTIVPEIEFESSINYTSWGDLSNLMGRIYHKMGLHYGHSGLTFWIRKGLFDKNIEWSDNDHVYEKFTLTRDFRQICEIGGFDHERWLQGFDTEEDAFEFVTNSKYFDKSLFLIENLNHINRVRNRKRPMYMRFIEYTDQSALEENSNPPSSNFLSKENYSIIFQKRFPELRERIDYYRFQNSIDNIVKEKINGHIIKDLFPEIDGKLIGQILNIIKETYSVGQILNMPAHHFPSIIQFTLFQRLSIVTERLNLLDKT
jgi:hypothetical protein